MSARTLVFLVAAALSLIATILHLPWIMKLLALVIVLGVLGYLAWQLAAQARDTEELNRLRAGYEQLDQQAKLIIRTDLELHRTQEELDRKLASLFALHELGQQLRISLHPDEIYGKLNAQLLTSFGFSKGLVGFCPEAEQLAWRSRIGVPEDVAEQIRRHLLSSGQLRELLAKPAPRLLKATAEADPSMERFCQLLATNALVIAGVVPHAGPAGCLLLGREERVSSDWRGDEELVAILTTQLAIAVENSMLYEEVWLSRQELENRIQERTRELAQINNQLVRLNKAKSDFVSAVSHELRTPLAAIKGYAALLRGGQFGPVASAQTERLTKIEKHTDLLAQLINNLLDIARIESGRVTMESRPIPVNELLETVSEMVKPQLDAKRIHLRTRTDGVTELLGDPTHMPRVFMNLLSNAIKYTPEGGSITVSLHRDGSQILAKIQDTGCGIAPQELPKLFQEFYRAGTPVNEQVRGTGLGLALVKRIVEAHHGQIWVESEPGKGSTFSFSLPATEPRETGRRSPEVRGTPEGTSA